MKVIHCCATNDHNGNPRRCYVLVNNHGTKCAVWDEGYEGHHAVHPDFREAAAIADRVKVTPREYRKLLKEYPTFPY